jgi:hypothetical protein
VRQTGGTAPLSTGSSVKRAPPGAFHAPNVFLERDAYHAKDRWHHEVISTIKVIRATTSSGINNVIPTNNVIPATI